MTNSVISNEEIEQRLKSYLISHKAELDEMITKKIGTSVRAAITDAFSAGDTYRNSDRGWAREFIYDEVNDQVQTQINNSDIEIDIEEVRKKANAALQRKLKHIDIDVKL